MRVAIGSDHAGFALKEAIKAFVAHEYGEVLDVGTHGTDSVDYPDYAAAVGAALREHRADRGIILCGSGVGASMAANRIPGIRAGLCHDTYSAHQGVEHDDMNVLVLGGRVVGSELAREVVEAFLSARFSGDGRHLRRLAKVTALENPLRALQLFGQSVWLDSIRRSLLTSGELQRLVDEDGVRGVTSNPAIFEKAVTGSSDYADILEAPGAASIDAAVLYETLAVRDIQQAADVLRRGLRRDGAARRVREPGSVAAACSRHGGHACGRAASVGRRRPPQPDDQGAGHAGGHRRGAPADRGGHQRQRHAAVRAGRLRTGRRGVHRWSGSAGRARRRSLGRRQRGELLRQPHRYRHRRRARRPAGEGLRAAGAAAAAVAPRHGRHREREARLPAVSGAVQRAALARAGRARRADAAAAVGQHGNEGRQLPRRGLRRGADRARHRQHDAAADARGLPRSRPSSRKPRAGSRRRLRHDADAGRRRHLAERDDGRAAGRRDPHLHRRVPETARRRRAAEPRNRRPTDPAALRARAAPRLRGRREGDAGRVAGAGQREAALGAGFHAVDRTRRGAVARVARDHQRPTGPLAAVRGHRGGGEERGVLRRARSSAWAARASAPRC